MSAAIGMDATTGGGLDEALAEVEAALAEYREAIRRYSPGVDLCPLRDRWIAARESFGKAAARGAERVMRGPGLHPATVALLDQVRAIYRYARDRREILTLDQVAAAIGRSKGRAQQLWTLSGLPPLARGRRPGAKPRKRRPTPRATSGAKGGRSKSPAKAEAARANLEAIRARRAEGVGRRPGPMSKEELAGMNVLEIDLMAATATSTREKARWIRRKVARGFTVTPEQAEILEIEGRRKSKIPRKRA